MFSRTELLLGKTNIAKLKKYYICAYCFSNIINRNHNKVMIIGAKINNLIKEHNITQEILADKVGVSQNDVAALNPNLSTPSIVKDAQGTVADRAQELGAKEKDLREGAKKKTDYEQDLEPNSKITRILQDKLGTFGGGDTPKK